LKNGNPAQKSKVRTPATRHKSPINSFADS
jgi:hypothetical protein